MVIEKKKDWNPICKFGFTMCGKLPEGEKLTIPDSYDVTMPYGTKEVPNKEGKIP